MNNIRPQPETRRLLFFFFSRFISSLTNYWKDKTRVVSCIYSTPILSSSSPNAVGIPISSVEEWKSVKVREREREKSCTHVRDPKIPTNKKKHEKSFPFDYLSICKTLLKATPRDQKSHGGT
jgi:hypothetical protein